MEQDSINQRLKFLAENLAESARAFSDAIGESPTNTHNYISGGRKPAPEYLRKLLLHYRNINARWLLTGVGDAFTSPPWVVTDASATSQKQSQNQKKNKGHIINHTGNGPTSYSLEDCKRECALLQSTCNSQEREIALLKSQLVDKQEIIDLLKQAKP